MNKKELIDAVAAKTGTSRADADRATAALIEVISDTLKKGDPVSLPGFGIFEVRERPAYMGRNPRTGEQLKIAAAKIPAFKPGAALKTAVKAEK
jgi:DNA-binding protein HU-beta